VIRRNKADGIILSNSFSNTVFGNTIAENRVGIHLFGSDQNYILNNTLEGNSVGGINLFYSSSNYLDSNVLIGNNGTGIILDFSSSNNALNGNMIAFTTGYGLTVGSGPNNVLRSNNLTANTYNFYCQAVRPNLSDFLNDIDSSNTVNGRPIYYIVNREGLVINSSNLKNAGYLALVNCAYITVDGMSFSENGQGLLLAFTSNTTLRGLKTSKNTYGIQLLSSVDNTLTNNTLLENYEDGITLDYSSINNTVTYNTITSSSNAMRMSHHISQCYIVGNLMANSAKGLWMYSYDDQNIIIDNVLTNNTQGIWMQSACSSNIIAQNTISDNAEGLYLNFCPYNLIFHNNFVNNTVQVVSTDSTNTWDFNYEGNYWSNYTGVDLNHDGIGDASHAIDADNIDRYPLMGTFYDFEVTLENGDTDHVQVVSNSTISNFTVLYWLSSPNQHLQPGQKYITFFTTGQDNTSGFCRVFIPRSVLNGTYIVLVDWQETPASELEASNTTHAYVYFTYEHSTHEVTIVPEFAPALIILVFIIATTSGAVACRRKRLHATSQRSLFKERKLDRLLLE
jgi:parallel beta-helix repeat protein